MSRRSRLASLWLASLPSAAGAQYPNPGPATQPETPVLGVSTDRPRFSVDGTVLPGTGTLIVRLDYRLARTELLFERRSAGYHAAYEVEAVFYHDKGGARSPATTSRASSPRRPMRRRVPSETTSSTTSSCRFRPAGTTCRW